MEAEIKLWKTRIDEPKVQIELGSMEARVKLQPELDKLEVEYDKAMKELKLNSKFGKAEKYWRGVIERC